MKVDLKKIRIAKSAITDTIYAGIPDIDKISFKHKKDITSDFLKAIIEYAAGKRVTINARNEQGENIQYECIVINKKTHEVKIKKK